MEIQLKGREEQQIIEQMQANQLQQIARLEAELVEVEQQAEEVKSDQAKLKVITAKIAKINDRLAQLRRAQKESGKRR